MEISKDRLTQAYQLVAATSAGKLVIADILSMCGYFANVPDRIDPKLIALAHTILSRLGVYGSDGVLRCVEALIESAPPVKINSNDKDEEEEL